jgi:hypothetical protein
MSRKARPETPNAFARMTAALKLPSTANAAPLTPEPKLEPASQITAPRTATTRINTKIVAGHFREPMHRALRIAGAEEGLTVQQILEEALHDWLVKKGAGKHLNI